MDKLNGFYRGIVKDNKDPLCQGRVKVYVLGIYPSTFENYPEKLPWAELSMPVFGGGYTTKGVSVETGVSSVPRIGAPVWVFFEQGDQNFPIVAFQINSGPGWISEHRRQHVIATENIKIVIDEEPTLPETGEDQKVYDVTVTISEQRPIDNAELYNLTHGDALYRGATMQTDVPPVEAGIGASGYFIARFTDKTVAETYKKDWELWRDTANVVNADQAAYDLKKPVPSNFTMSGPQEVTIPNSAIGISTNKFDSVAVENTLTKTGHKLKMIPTKVMVSIDATTLASEDKGALYLDIKGIVNLNITGDVYERHTGNKHKTHIGNLYVYHEGDSYIEEVGVVDKKLAGKRTTTMQGTVDTFIEGSNSTSVTGDEKKTYFKDQDITYMGECKINYLKGLYENVTGNRETMITGNDKRIIYGNDESTISGVRMCTISTLDHLVTPVRKADIGFGDFVTCKGNIKHVALLSIKNYSMGFIQNTAIGAIENAAGGAFVNSAGGILANCALGILYNSSAAELLNTAPSIDHLPVPVPASQFLMAADVPHVLPEYTLALASTGNRFLKFLKDVINWILYI